MRENSDKQIFSKIQQFSNLSNKVVLEIGCGDGRISRFLINKTEHLTGIDPDEETIKGAQVNIPKGKFIVGSGENLDFSNEFFDLVIFTLSLHHQDSKKALREAARVLKKDGFILVIEPLIDGEIECVFSIVNNEDQAKLDAQQALKESNLLVEQSEVFDAYWFFENKEELSEFVFNYYNLPFRSTLAQKIYDYLGVNSQNSQLKLLDRMIIQVLSKNVQQDRHTPKALYPKISGDEMDSQHATAYCGIYCPDCIRYKNKYDRYARQLRNELENVEFHKYAAIDTPFGANFKKYNEFSEVLNALANTQCNKPCRVGGGCSGNPCKIMECCIDKGFEGCWECTKLDECEKFDILEPRCGEMPKNNIKTIRKYGIQKWIELRDKFYIWQKK